MGKMKDWMMDMDEQIAFAMENGATSTSDVVAMARTNLKLLMRNISSGSSKKSMDQWTSDV